MRRTARPIQPAAASLVIAAGPIRAAAAKLDADLAILRRYAPNGEVASALHGALEVLRCAIREAETTHAYATPETIAHLVNRPLTTVRDWFESHGVGRWCEKAGGRWSADLDGFLTWYKENAPTLEARRRNAGSEREDEQRQSELGAAVPPRAA